MAKNIAQLMVDTLVQAGVERVYGLPGDSLNGFTDSIRKQKKLQWIRVRHEETAAFAAGAEAHLTGRLAVCAGSCGPGNMHVVTAMIALYLNVFVLIVQSFEKIPALHVFAPTQTESPFKLTQLIVLALFLCLPLPRRSGFASNRSVRHKRY
jgi:sulfopyruvate decarboxylase TPP-binding subunit